MDTSRWIRRKLEEKLWIWKRPGHVSMMTSGEELGIIGSHRPKTEMDREDLRRHISKCGWQMLTRETERENIIVKYCLVKAQSIQ